MGFGRRRANYSGESMTSYIEQQFVPLHENDKSLDLSQITENDVINEMTAHVYSVAARVDVQQTNHDVMDVTDVTSTSNEFRSHALDKQLLTKSNVFCSRGIPEPEQAILSTIQQQQQWPIQQGRQLHEQGTRPRPRQLNQ
jgi:hypothetical protein